MLDILPNTLLQAFTFGIAAVGVAIAFRVVRYPDLTADGSFILGSTVFAFATPLTGDWLLSLVLSTAAGASAGLFTSLLNTWFGVSRLLSGILTTMVAYSLAFRLLGGRSNIGLTADGLFAPPAGLHLDAGLAASLFAVAIAASFAVVAIVLIWRLLSSELGLLMRATGSNAGLIEELGRSPAAYRAVGLMVANGLVGLAAALVSAQQGFVDINLGVGVVITLVAALVLGEELFNSFGFDRRASFAKRAIAPIVGAGLYFLLYLLILRASIQGWLPVSVEPTDLKLISAILVIAVVALRRTRSSQEEVLPL